MSIATNDERSDDLAALFNGIEVALEERGKEERMGSLRAWATANCCERSQDIGASEPHVRESFFRVPANAGP